MPSPTPLFVTTKAVTLVPLGATARFARVIGTVKLSPARTALGACRLANIGIDFLQQSGYLFVRQMVLAPVLFDFCFRKTSRREKPPQSNLCGGFLFYDRTKPCNLMASECFPSDCE
jgi:hypothetical protein